MHLLSVNVGGLAPLVVRLLSLMQRALSNKVKLYCIRIHLYVISRGKVSSRFFHTVYKMKGKETETYFKVHRNVPLCCHFIYNMRLR